MRFLVQVNFFKEKQDEKKEDIYSNIDEMLNSTLDEEEKDT
jgi:segregation and condensation protein B